MRCADILHVIEEHYPLSYALDWDNCGLQTGRFDKDVQTIYIALDAGDESCRSSDYPSSTPV